MVCLQNKAKKAIFWLQPLHWYNIHYTCIVFMCIWYKYWTCRQKRKWENKRYYLFIIQQSTQRIFLFVHRTISSSFVYAVNVSILFSSLDYCLQIIKNNFYIRAVHWGKNCPISVNRYTSIFHFRRWQYLMRSHLYYDFKHGWSYSPFRF